jgi:hypothetical protein
VERSGRFWSVFFWWVFGVLGYVGVLVRGIGGFFFLGCGWVGFGVEGKGMGKRGELVGWWCLGARGVN